MDCSLSSHCGLSKRFERENSFRALVIDGRVMIATILSPERQKPFDSQEKSSRDYNDEEHFDLIGRSYRVPFVHRRIRHPNQVRTDREPSEEGARAAPR